MQESDFFKKAVRIIKEGYVCDNCLGRQFAQLLSGLENRERGKAVRNFLAMSVDSGKETEADPSNFHGYTFRFSKLGGEKAECVVCGGLFANLETYVEKAMEKLKGLEFSTFLVGTRLSRKLIGSEEGIWEKVGIEWCEPMKSEINRLIGKELERELGRSAEFKNPEILVIVNLRKRDVDVEINSLYVYGEYNKLVRSIPQTRWPSGKYKTSVEEIAAKPFLKKTKGSGSKFHGAGREDIDARCLAWRPFVLEITEPRKRSLKLREMTRLVNKSRKIQVRKLKFVDSDVVEHIKTIRPDKSYRVVVRTRRNLEKGNLERLSLLRNKRIYQETPSRVVHRRADKLRKRVVKDMKWKKLGKRSLELVIRAEAGTYIKELVSGDKGRTYPSVSELLGMKAEVKELDVVKIHRKKS